MNEELLECIEIDLYTDAAFFDLLAHDKEKQEKYEAIIDEIRIATAVAVQKALTSIFGEGVIEVGSLSLGNHVEW